MKMLSKDDHNDDAGNAEEIGRADSPKVIDNNFSPPHLRSLTENHRQYSSSSLKANGMTTYTTFTCAYLLFYVLGTNAFTLPPRSLALSGDKAGRTTMIPTNKIFPPDTFKSSRRTSLDMVWWFGGTPGESETSTSGEECELVAVRIDRTSPNSRRIAGEIVVDASLMDVWTILTDYDNLSTHVPNLVASRRISNGGGEAGDGSHRCRLYQRGAQKIIGFEFGADVTMDMTENIVVAGKSSRMRTKSTTDTLAATIGAGPALGVFAEERRIDFKCVDSQFFSEFDGSWRVVQMPVNPFTGEPETTVSYSVEVRPRGPVPVAALEWRIREDVPTNLRAVKKAAKEVGLKGVLAKRNRGRFNGIVGTEQIEAASGFADFILDFENETLGAYMK